MYKDFATATLQMQKQLIKRSLYCACLTEEIEAYSRPI